MTTSMTTLALALFLAGTAVAQQQPRRSANSKSSAGTSTAPDINRANSSTTRPQEGASGAPTGTGLTNDQVQAANAPNHTTETTKVDAQSSTIKGHSTDIKPNKIKPRKQNR